MPVTIDITDDIPFEIGVPLAGSTTASAKVPANIRWDCSIGSLPFLFGFSDQNPMLRETGQFRRDRVDNQREPGEQSLDSGFWIRSQSSWHYGSGISSAEPLEVNEQEARFRYSQGGGVNVWTPGQVSLLNDTSQALSATGSGQLLLGVDTGVIHATGNAMKYVPSTGSTVTITWGGANPITSIASNGYSWFAGSDDGIYKGTLPSGAGTKIYNASGSILVRWVKSRVIASVGPALYEITSISPASPPAALPTALYTHPTPGWVWTDFAEGPSAIYAAGYSGDTSLIYKIDVTATSTTTTLSQPVVVAELPRGEIVYSLYSYLGSYMVVGTSKGARLATINNSYTASGTLTMGPLTVTSTDGCRDAVADGSFVYVTVGAQGTAGNRATRAGIWRIALSTNLNQNPLLFANAADLVAPAGVTGACHQVTLAGGKLWFTVDGSGVFKQASTFVDSGWMETGRIRLGTVEAKAWRDIRLLGTPDMGGTVTARASLYAAPTPSTWDQIISISGNSPDATGKLVVTFPTPQSDLYLAFNLATSDTSVSPTFAGYQVRAIPAPRRSELVQVPLLNFDFTVDRVGSRYGHTGLSWEMYQLMKALEGSASTVQWRDYTTGERAEAYIEQVKYTRNTPPTRNVSGNGGVLTVTLRLVG